MKYDNMVRRNRRVNEEKKERAIFAIKKLLLENEPVTVSTLAEKTGLSREFFYKNEKVRQTEFFHNAPPKEVMINSMTDLSFLFC